MASVIDDAQKRIRETFVNVPKLPNIKYNINWLANAKLLVGDTLQRPTTQDDETSIVDGPENGVCSNTSFSLWNLTTTSFFEMYIQTLCFGLLLYIADTVSDLFNGFIFYIDDDIAWSAMTLGVVLLPGLVRGLYEVFRRPVDYTTSGKDVSTQNWRQGFLTRLNFGLDVIPSASIDLSTTNIFWKIVLAPFYIIIMAFVFQILPIFQYVKVFKLQWQLKYQKRKFNFDEESIFEEATEEVRRAVNLKAVEAFMEAAPQFFLQIYIMYKRNKEVNSFEEMSWWSTLAPFVAMAFSFISLLKTSNDLQDVDRLDHAVSATARPVLFFWTSNFFFSSVIVFRSLSISVVGLFSSHLLKGIIAAPLLFLLISNVILRIIFERSGALIAGAMSAVAPAKFICASNLRREEKTRNYLIVYTVFNTLAHCAGIIAVYVLKPDLDDKNNLFGKNFFWIYILPFLGFFAILSPLATFIHWWYSLRHLFRADVKFPEFSKYDARLKTFKQNRNGKPFPKTSKQHYAENGLFCQPTSSGPRLCCYDCGLTMPVPSDSLSPKNINETIAVIHSAQLFGYQIHYKKSIEDNSASGSKGNPDILKQAYSRLIRVKPVCGFPSRQKIDFTKTESRLKTFELLMEPGDILSESKISIKELAEAGYVRTSPMNSACFFCHKLLDLSNSKTRFNSPWAIHVWSQYKAQKPCEHVVSMLSKVEIRLKTYPEEWNSLTLDQRIPSPKLLADSGFYCSVNNYGGFSWVQCFCCPVYAGYQIKQEIQKKKQLAARAKILSPEIPGLAYAENNLVQISLRNKSPLVSHYIQQNSCSFLQEIFQHNDERLKTFPEKWSEINDLRVSAEDVAAANFVYFPMSQTSQRIHVNQDENQEENQEKCPVTQCPKCKKIVDWSLETLSPKNVFHC